MLRSKKKRIPDWFYCAFKSRVNRNVVIQKDNENSIHAASKQYGGLQENINRKNTYTQDQKPWSGAPA